MHRLLPPVNRPGLPPPHPIATFLRFPVTLDALPKCAFLAALACLDLRALLPAARIFNLADVPLVPVLERLLVTLLTDPTPSYEGAHKPPSPSSSPPSSRT